MLDMDYYGYGDNYIEKSIRCQYITSDEPGRDESQNYADGVLVKLYIENTKCLDWLIEKRCLQISVWTGVVTVLPKHGGPYASVGLGLAGSVIQARSFWIRVTVHGAGFSHEVDSDSNWHRMLRSPALSACAASSACAPMQILSHTRSWDLMNSFSVYASFDLMIVHFPYSSSSGTASIVMGRTIIATVGNTHVATKNAAKTNTTLITAFLLMTKRRSGVKGASPSGRLYCSPSQHAFMIIKRNPCRSGGER